MSERSRGVPELRTGTSLGLPDWRGARPVAELRGNQYRRGPTRTSRILLVKGWSKIEIAFATGARRRRNIECGRTTTPSGRTVRRNPINLLSGSFSASMRKRENGSCCSASARGSDAATKIKFVLKDGVLILDGSDGDPKKTMPWVYTGKYKGVKRKK
jgi:hypothetical protein